ncbi:Peptidoglycan-associated lipoprotein [Achromobacter deleyi]|uniref:Peptidoglycan-associated lipoprotein n=1 Tax=Achromobacter deleyi TaxID=1353891 RepID=A0A6S7A8V0_9BURK|nr:OmpA family protein [Achromobacter deleyi]CAB3720056.1 Peptidoglycan-associated lipoprotein [Achromobacter deleyi]CAB3874520.1 Peptidoglycan-associated lipoprotein [Achromobacter deleyi]CAB3881657.1 Peptidoglycan-associated lipoprotein [Achromobacter deleyi]
MKAPIVASACLAIAALCLGALQPAWAEDVPGSSDHPALTRFKGAEIRAYERKDYDEAFMPNQPIAQESAAKGLQLEGKVTRISYRISGGKSALEVYRNYQGALQSGGFKTVFECKGDDQCGSDFQSFVINGGKVSPPGKGDAAFGGKYYVALAKKEAPSGDLYVFLDVMEDSANQITPVYVQVVETKPMQTGQVQVLDMAAMQKSLAESGRVAVYGVYFDTDKAEVKPESKAALDEMGKLLKANPNLKVYVVGHTDNQGTLARNLDLSQKRADAVVKALEADYKIAAARLSPRGVASLAPVAANDAEAGRAKNRRVELVSQ